MHMADALISPAVGGTMAAVTAGLIGYSSLKVKKELDDKKIPLMGVMGAFIFAAQMINFTIPATGSSGHLGGGLILSIILGPYAAFLTMASVLIIQALFFGDGGLLALGCNIFNLGFFTCFLAYPFIYKKIVGHTITKSRLFAGAIIAAIIGLQMGAFGVVLETLLSGISELPFKTFFLIMQPIHLGIGIVEGIATAAISFFIFNARPEILEEVMGRGQTGTFSIKKVLIGLAIAALFTGGIASWFASSNPDGLEWAMFRTAGVEELKQPENDVHATLAEIQKKTVILPDYNFKTDESEKPEEAGGRAADNKKAGSEPKSGSEPEPAPWPAVNPGTTFSGILGGVLTLLLAVIIGFILKKRKGVA